MLDIKKSEANITYQELYWKTEQRPISEMIRKRQLKFIGHCLRMWKEQYSNLYDLYKSEEIRQNSVGDIEICDQISRHVIADQVSKLTANEIARLK